MKSPSIMKVLPGKPGMGFTDNAMTWISLTLDHIAA